jgi:hypothetical protein
MITIFRTAGKITKIETNQVGKDVITADYDALMKKYDKVAKYMDDEKIPLEKKLPYMPQLMSLLEEISASLVLLKFVNGCEESGVE